MAALDISKAGALLAAATLSGAAAHAAKPAAATFVIEIKQMAFAPPPAVIHVGDTIEWRNDDIFRHSATAKTGEFDFNLPPKAVARVVLKKPGVIAFYCRYHPGMTGKLTVQPR